MTTKYTKRRTGGVVLNTFLVSVILLLTLGYAKDAKGGVCDSCPLVVLGPCALAADLTCTTVWIGPDGILDTGSHTLTITGSGGLICLGDLAINGTVILNGGGSHFVNGAVYLYSSNSRLLIEDSDASIIGSGRIAGEDNGAELDIESGRKLTVGSSASIVGALEIKGAGSFTNNGVVNADFRGTLKINSTGTIAGSGTWRASSSFAELAFFKGASGLTGPFCLSGNATITFDGVVVNTTGLFRGACGLVNIANGGSFTHGSPPTTISSDTFFDSWC